MTIVVQMFDCESDKYTVFIMPAQSAAAIFACAFRKFSIIVDASFGTLLKTLTPAIFDIQSYRLLAVSGTSGLEGRVMGFLEYQQGKVSLDQLRNWFAPISMNLVSSGSPEQIRKANAIIGEFSDFDEGLLSEEQLKNNLSAILKPSQFPYHIQMFVFDGLAAPVQSGTAAVIAEMGDPASVGVGYAWAHA